MEFFELFDIFCENLIEKFNEFLVFIFYFCEKLVYLNCNVWFLVEELLNKCVVLGGLFIYIIWCVVIFLVGFFSWVCCFFWNLKKEKYKN